MIKYLYKETLQPLKLITNLINYQTGERNRKKTNDKKINYVEVNKNADDNIIPIPKPIVIPKDETD